MIEDPRSVGGWLEFSVSRLVVRWVFPISGFWVLSWFLGYEYLATEGGILFPTVTTTFFGALLGTYYHHTRPFHDWDDRESMIMTKLRDPMEPRGEGVPGAVFFLVFYTLHPIVTLGIPGIVTGGEIYPTIAFGVFVLGMLIFKYGVILYSGIDTPHDASLHTGSATFAVFGLGTVDTTAFVLAPLIAIVGVTVWWFRSHTVAGVLGGFGIGAIAGSLFFLV